MAKSADPTEPDHLPHNANETTPLLGVPTVEPAALEATEYTAGDTTKPPLASTYGTSPSDEAVKDEPPKPFAYGQILILCYGSLVEPVAYFSIFPYINEMIEKVGHLEKANVGYWSGGIESLFSFVQMILFIFYGRLSDRLGRKPVLIFTLAGLGCAIATFGLSQSLWQMVLFRCLAGCFAGSAVTTRVMLSENCDKSSQARAFSWLMFTRNLGILLGPLVGGVFVSPAESYPGAFGRIKFFKEYPYALPSFVTGLFSISAAVISYFGLNETLKRELDEQGNTKQPASIIEVLRSPGVASVLYIACHCITLGLAYTALGPLTLFQTVETGGLGFSKKAIAIYLAIGGASQSLWMLLAFPPLQRRLGTGNLLRLCATVWPIFMAGMPYANELLRHGLDTAFWITVPALYVLGSSVAMGFACVQLCINDVSPPAVLGTVNALALTTNSGIRAVAPFFFSAISAYGTRTQWADGHLAWIVLIVLAAGLRLACVMLPEGAEGRPAAKRKVHDNDTTS